MSQAVAFSESPMAKRVPLAEQVPLEKPFTVEISTSRICDFRCEFCTQSLESARKAFHKMGNNGFMDMQLLQRIVDDVKASFGHIKQIHLTGLGEPLLNPKIGEMVAYIAKQNVCDRISLITNGTHLTPKMSDELVNAGLSRLRISINGLNDADFLKYCNAQVDFEQYVEQIRYLNEHKKQMTLYIKIINYMVDTAERMEKFYQTFGPICDVINVENLIENSHEIDFKKFTKNPDQLHYSKATSENISHNICTTPFLSISVDEDGYVWPCCDSLINSFSKVKPPCYGNVKDTSFGFMWENKVLPFQRRLLDGTSGIPYCENCTSKASLVYQEDVLDESAERLKEKYRQIVTQKGEQKWS